MYCYHDNAWGDMCFPRNMLDRKSSNIINNYIKNMKNAKSKRVYLKLINKYDRECNYEKMLLLLNISKNHDINYDVFKIIFLSYMS